MTLAGLSCSVHVKPYNCFESCGSVLIEDWGIFSLIVPVLCASLTEPKMSKKYTQHLRNEWLSDPKYEKWLNKIEGDNTKCLCKYCHCSLSAKLSDIERHRGTAKHKKAEEPFSGQRQTFINFETISDDVRETEGSWELADLE